MPAGAYDVVFSQRNAANTKFSEIIIEEDPNGFFGFSPGNALGIYLVTNDDIADSSIELEKIVDVPAYSFIGNSSDESGPLEVLTSNEVIEILNTTGDVHFTQDLIPINYGSFTHLTKTIDLGEVTTTQTIDVQDEQEIPLRLIVKAELSTNNVTFNFTNFGQENLGMEIILILENGGTSRNVTVHVNGGITATRSGINNHSTTENVPSGEDGFSIFGMFYDGSYLHVNNLQYV